MVPQYSVLYPNLDQMRLLLSVAVSMTVVEGSRSDSRKTDIDGFDVFGHSPFDLASGGVARIVFGAR